MSLIRSFHEGMLASMQECGETSDLFPVTNGTKQGCVLAPTLFSIVFSLMLFDAFHDLDRGVHIQFRSDGGMLNLRRLQARTKTQLMLIKHMLFADMFARASERFGWTISIKKTEVMYQPAPDKSHKNPIVTINNTPLKSVETFCYLGSILSNSTTIDDEMTQRIAKASFSFGRLRRRLWNEHGVRTKLKATGTHSSRTLRPVVSILTVGRPLLKSAQSGVTLATRVSSTLKQTGLDNSLRKE